MLDSSNPSSSPRSSSFIKSYIHYRISLNQVFRMISPSGRAFSRADPSQRNKAHLIADLKEMCRLLTLEACLLGLTCATAYCGAVGKTTWKPFVLFPLAMREILMLKNYSQFKKAFEIGNLTHKT